MERKGTDSMAEREINKVHFIGIGGVGMSGIAHVAHDQGLIVSGSDLRESRYTQQLEDAGITIHIGHDPANIPDPAPDVVVVSTAILDNNPELVAARERGIKVCHRAQMLATLGHGKQTLAVAGTHGKTTTSSMLASTLDGMGLDPTFLIGGIVRSYHTNAHSGTGRYYVVEADESDKSFTYLDPYAVLVTNIEADHLDHYSDLQEIYRLFTRFMGSVPEDGVIVVCGDRHDLVEHAKQTGRRVVTYGFGDECDAQIINYVPCGIGSTFSLRLPNDMVVSSGVKQNPGQHNALNAAGVLTMIWALDEDVQKAAEILRDFAGVRRRFDLVGKAHGVTIVDDYAHHPTEIAATITAADKLDFKRVIVLFQPHRYSRIKLFTEVLRKQFSHAFDGADEAVFMDVYPAGEMPIPGVSGQTFMEVLNDNPDHPKLHYVARRQEIVSYLMTQVRPGDLVITMGAGDVTAMGPQLLDELQAVDASSLQE